MGGLWRQARLGDPKHCQWPHPPVVVVSVTALGWCLLVVLLLLGSWEGARLIVSACQWFLKGSALADPDSSRPRSLPGEGGHDLPARHGPHHRPSSVGALLSSPPPARSQADLESAARRLDRLPLVSPALALAAIDPSPNLPAFRAGVELGVFTALFTISSLLVVNWIVKTMRSSSK